MTDPTPIPVNPAATEANKVIKAIEGVLLPVIEKAIQTAVPTLSLPVVKQIVDASESAIADTLTKLLETGVTFIIIDTQTDGEQNKISNALKSVIAAEQSGNQNEIASAIQAYQEAQSQLIHDDGSAVPQ